MRGSKVLHLILAFNLGAFWPLSTLVVYAEDIAPPNDEITLTEEEDVLVGEVASPLADYEIEVEDPDADTLASTEESNTMIIEGDVDNIPSETEEEANEQSVLGIDIAQLLSSGQTYVSTDGRFFLIKPNENVEIGQTIPKSAVDSFRNNIQNNLDILNINQGRRLVLRTYDLVALTGELPNGASGNGERCEGFDPENNDQHDLLNNDACDPPRVDARIIGLLDYLLKPRREGGAGREYLEVKRIVSFTGENDEQLTKNNPENVPAEDVGDSSPHFIDVKKTNPRDINYASQAIDISAIDRIRVTTRVRRTGLFGSSNKYSYQPPIPIKVAWQSNEGIDRTPLPAISVNEMLQGMTFDNMLSFLDFGSLVEEPDLSGRPLESLSTEDLAKYLGAKLLAPLLDGQSLNNFNFGDVINDFGVLALAGSLNIDADVIRGAKSLAEIEELQGRSFVGKKLNLSEPLQGDTSTELLQELARSYLADRMGIVSHVLDGYSGPTEFILKLGQGLIEARLPIEEHSFDGASLDDVRAAMRNRFSIIFRDIETPEGQEQASQIDERLEIAYGSTSNLLRGNIDLNEYKKRAGNVIWNNYIYRYAEGDYAPLHPQKAIDPVISTADPVHPGSLTNVFANTAADPGLNALPESTSRSVLNAQAPTIRNRVSSLITSIQSTVPAPPIQSGTINTPDYNDSNANITARSIFLDKVDDFVAEIDGIIADINALQMAIMSSVNGANPESEYSLYSVYEDTDPTFVAVNGYLNSQISLLNSSRTALLGYLDNGLDADGTSQRRDQMWGLPGGSWYAIIGGNINQGAFQNALTEAGISIVKQKYSASVQEQEAFARSVKATTVGNTIAFNASNSTNDYFTDIFLTTSPTNAFRHLGRRVLINNLKESAQAESVGNALGADEIISTVNFYTDRYEIMRSSINTIRDEIQNLEGNLPADLIDTINQLDSSFSVDPNNATINAVQGIVRLDRNKIYTVIDAADNRASSQSATKLLQAARSLERASMEILEGRSVAFDSIIPTNADDIQIQTDVDALFGNDRFLRDAGFETLAGLTTGNLDMEEVLYRLGTRKLSRLFELPSESLNIFRLFIENNGDGIENFFASIGASRSGIAYERINDDNRNSLSDAGQQYIATVSLPALAKRLGIDWPDWISPNDIANLMTGNPTRMLVGLGATQLERELELPSGFIGKVIYPSGATQEDRERNREQAIIGVALSEIGIEIDLPRNFTITGNPVKSLGTGRLEEITGVPRDLFSLTPQELARSLSQSQESDLTDQEEVRRSYERFLSTYGVRLSQETINLRKAADLVAAELASIDRYSETGYYITQDYIGKVEAYVNGLAAHVNAILTGNQLPGSNTVERQLSYLQRLEYLDNRIGIGNHTEYDDNKGATQRWLEGTIDTNSYVNQAGQESAELFGTDLLSVGLQRLGISGPIFDAVNNRRHELVDLLKKENWEGNDFAMVYEITSQAFSFNLDKALNFDQGTVVEMIRRPQVASALLIDQGTRLFASQLLGIDLDSNENGSDIKNLVQRVLVGGFYDKNTNTFQPFNGFDGDQAVLQSIDAFRFMAVREINNIIPDDLQQWFRVPLTITNNILVGNLNDMGLVQNYGNIASAGEKALALARESGDVNEETNRLIQTVQAGQYPAASSSVNNYALYESLDNGANMRDGFTSDSEIDQSLSDLPSGDPEYSQPVSDFDYPSDYPSGDNYRTEEGRYEYMDDAAASQAVTDRSNIEANRKEARLFTSQQAEVVAKEFGYALADIGMSEILGENIVSPGLARALFNSSPENRTNTILYVASNWLHKNHGNEILGDFSYVIDFNNLKDLYNFFDNLTQDDQLALGAILSNSDGIISSIQNQYMSDGIWKDLGLKPGTLAGIFSFAITGSTKGSSIGGFDVKGLEDLYNIEWVLSTSFRFVEKWFDIPAGTLSRTFQLSYNFFTAFSAFNKLSSIKTAAAEAQEMLDFLTNLDEPIGDLANLEETAQSFTDAGGATKLSQLKVQYVNAAIQLGIYLVDLAFGKTLAVFEKALGLPPGTILGGVSLLLTALLIGMGPMFWVSLGIFVIATLLGFGRTRITTAATADGYYPFAGKKGVYSPPKDPNNGNIPYSQWPSADLLNNTGQLSKAGLGEFDPTNDVEKKDGFMTAAQSKVRGLLVDLFSITDRAAQNSILPAGSCTAEEGCFTDFLIPTQVMVHEIKNTNRSLMYVDEPQLQHLTRQYRPNRANTDDPEYKYAKWGLWARPEFWDAVHIGY